MEAIFVPVVTIIMVFSIPIVAIITEHKAKSKKAEIIKKAIEMGTPIDNLKLDEAKPRMPYRSGMVMVAIGIGVTIFGLLFLAGPEARAVFLSGGAIVGLIGVALLINDKMNYERLPKND